MNTGNITQSHIKRERDVFLLHPFARFGMLIFWNDFRSFVILCCFLFTSLYQVSNVILFLVFFSSLKSKKIQVTEYIEHDMAISKTAETVSFYIEWVGFFFRCGNRWNTFVIPCVEHSGLSFHLQTNNDPKQRRWWWWIQSTELNWSHHQLNEYDQDN